MKSAPWIQSGVIVSLAFMGISVLLEPHVLYSAKAPFFAFLAAGVLITQQMGRIIATTTHRIGWVDNLSLLLAAVCAGCSGWYWIAADANGPGEAWAISFVALFFMLIMGFIGWLAYTLFGNAKSSEGEE